MTDRIAVKTLEVSAPEALAVRGPIHTRAFTGLFRNLRRIGAGILMLIFFATVWLNHNGHQAVLWDIEDRKFFIFGATFWPQDFVLLSALLIIAAFGLFFITVLAGRVWCGYSCPQSMWMWLFMWAEKVTEGDRAQRIKLSSAPFGFNKLVKRTLKHSLWLFISVATAITFVGYFTPVRELVIDLVTLEVGLGAGFWVAAFTVATYLNAGFLREQVCVHMCPYSRFQSVMFDQDTLVVAYDAARGEPRGARNKSVDAMAQGLGSCIDCTLCVQVCPTGIDIRQGLQIECIGCGACVDVCNSVMDKMGYAPNLISYTSERAQTGGKTHFLRPSAVGYGAALVAMIGLFIWALVSRDPLDLNVIKDRAMYRTNALGQVENDYLLRLINKTQEPRQYEVRLVTNEPLSMPVKSAIKVDAGEVYELPVTVVLPKRDQVSTRKIHFELRELASEASVLSESIFTSPIRY